MDNFVKLALENGGIIKPLIFDSKDFTGPSLNNPSILILNEKIIVNIRNVNYTLYHSELDRFEHIWGPLTYVHPEDDMHLRTWNYIAQLDDDLNVEYYSKIDTSKFPDQELWEFVGLEDGRLVNWEDKIYLCGVRRDTTPNGVGRMEMCELEFDDESVKEVSRYRIPGPPPDDEYCMKNCTPIEGKPFHLIKWTNPTCIMKFDPNGGETIVKETTSYVPGYNDMRGGSQVIKYKDGYLTIIHETDLYDSVQGRKNGTYRHRFVYWNHNFTEQKFSKLFSFLNMKIEFCCGLTKYKNDYLITFGASDNAAYILKISESFLEDFINE